MTELKEVICPSCNGSSYFPSDKNAGYCINCGRIVNCDSGNTRPVSIGKAHASSRKEYTVSITYNRTSRDYDQALRVELMGAENRVFYVSKDRAETIKLPEGQYQLAFFSHISQGVLSTDVVNSVNIDVNRNRTIVVETKRPIFAGWELLVYCR
ncbi:MAG: hypothetical protein E7Z70_04340 [Thermoplasmata archaeon]|nr:hypothetical protein [Thermoplasmata archaeon]